MENNNIKKPLRILRKDDGEVFELQPDGRYANAKLVKESVMRWKLEHFDEKYFKFEY